MTTDINTSVNPKGSFPSRYTPRSVREREQANAQRHKLCISEPYPRQQFCWCICNRCWSRDISGCICADCECKRGR